MNLLAHHSIEHTIGSNISIGVLAVVLMALGVVFVAVVVKGRR